MKTSTFLEFIWKDQQNRKVLFRALCLSIISFILFKLLYPYPDFFSDSYSYISAASTNMDISIWPIGYSKFLALFHALTYSDIAFVAFQYFSLQLAAIYFYFTILYFYNTSSITQKALFIFIFINPLSLYLCNTINSDALFAALSILWFTQLIWILHKPLLYQIFIQGILLFLCFTVRNNAYYYPLIAILAFFLSRHTWKAKALGIILPFFLIVPFVIHTRTEAFKLTGTRQFSLFTGWQLANNALYIYDQIEVDSSALPTAEARELNRLSLGFVAYYNSPDYRPFLESFVGNFFIKQSDAPLKQYYFHHFQSAKTEQQVVANWGEASAAFEPFGKYIISHHPIAYVRYFMLPNTLHYFLPPLSHIEVYNYGENNIDPKAQVWFHYPKPEVHCFSHNLQGLLIIYEALFLLFNLYYLLQFIKHLRRDKIIASFINIYSSHWLTAGFILLNFGFSVFATLNILRYQIVPMLLLLAFGLLASDYLEETEKKRKPRSQINVSKDFLTSAENHAQ